MNYFINPDDAPYYEELLRYCTRLIKSEAKDIVQETYARLYMTKRNLKGAHLRNWLFRVARNLIIDRLRLKYPELIDPDVEGASLLDAPDGKFVNPAIAAEQQELIQVIIAMLECCDERTREIFRLSFYECCSSSEIAKRVNVSSSTVRKILLGKIQEFREAFQQMDAVG